MLDSIAYLNWLDRLDLRRAHDKLQGLKEFPVPWRSDASTLLGAVVAGRDSALPSPASFEDDVLGGALKMHAGPIPGVSLRATNASLLIACVCCHVAQLDLSRFVPAAESPVQAGEPSASAKRRATSEDVSRSGSPSDSDRSGAASPSGSKKPRAQSIVRSTYYSAR